jgi:ribosomal protein S12 methylthiotransferase
MKTNPEKPKVHVLSLGCAKNLVDSEKLMAQLTLGRVEVTQDPEQADIAVINTCGFIEAAKRESINAMIAAIRRKSARKLRKVYAMGCLTERYRDELMAERPELDGVFGSNELGIVLRALGTDLKYELLGERVRTTPKHYAYLKISEGCDNPCSFCAIPIMRGKHFSRPADEIIAEATRLAEDGTKELIVIGQDTTYYGLDITGKRELAGLLEALAGIRGIEWVRLMYAYPARFPLSILPVLHENPHVCRYLDIPVQHCSDAVLRSMRRGISARKLRSLLDLIRDRVPGIALRTTLIVGYPNETRKEFDELLGFVEEMRFARLGVFSYSLEDGTTAFPLGDPVSAKEKERRVALVMELQREISLRRNEEQIGSRKRVLVERFEEGQWVGRTESDAPEIDNEVFFPGSEHELRAGEFVDIDIMDASEYDLYGVLAVDHQNETPEGMNESEVA